MSYQQTSLIMVFGMVGIGILGLIIYMLWVHWQHHIDEKRADERQYWEQRRNELFPCNQKK